MKRMKKRTCCTAIITLAAQSRFLSIQYNWSDSDQPQDGLLIVSHAESLQTVHAVWIDSWHMGDLFMWLKGNLTTADSVSVQGSYAASPGPDWGWRIDIETGASDRFRGVMYNISPEGEQALAVEANYTRQS